MKNNLSAFYELLVLKRPLLTLLVTLIVIGWLSTHIPDFRLDASADSLVLEGDEDLKYYREIGKRYAAEEFLLVTFRPQQALLSDQSLATLDKLRGELVVLDGVSSVVTILDVPLLESPKVTLEEVASGDGIRTLRTPGIDKQLVLNELTYSPIYKNLLTSSDGRTTALQVNLQRNERYQSMLQQREALREKKTEGLLSQDETQQLVALEKDFRTLAEQVTERQGELVEEVRSILQPYRGGAQVFLGGVPMIAADMISFVKSDLVVFGSGILIFIIVLLAMIFRHLMWVLLPLATCLLTASFMLGLLTWLDWRMTVISSNFVALLLIITLSITIHLIVRYRELFAEKPELDQKILVREMVFSMFKPCIYTALTTIVAFASLVVSGIRPVIDFGWMMTMGVTAALVLTFVILPAGLAVLGKPKAPKATTTEQPMTLYFARFTEARGGLILWASVLLAAISMYGVSQLEVENRFIDYFHKDTEIYQGMEIIDAQLGGTIPLEIIIDPLPEGVQFDTQDLSEADNTSSVVASEQVADINVELNTVLGDDFDEGFDDDFGDDFSDDFDEEGAATEPSYWFNRAGLSQIEQVHDYLESLDETGKVLSLATPYKVLRNLTSGIDDIQLTLIQSKLPEEIKSILIDPYLNEEIDQARITVRVMETSRSLRRADLLAKVEKHLVDELGFHPDQVRLTGMLVLYNNMLQSLYRSQILTLGAVFIAIVLMFVALFRSLPVALITIAPNILAAGIVLGGMGLVGIPLDIMTVTIAAITVGIAVDDTIHYVHRFRTEFAKDNNYLATMYRCHNSIGKAMFYTSITVVVGFSILALSNFTPSIYFGLLTGVAMFAALIGALLLLPQLLITFKPLGPNVELPDAESSGVNGVDG